MRKLEVRANIAAPVERVWAILAEVENWPQWTASIARIERLSSGPIGVGSCLRIEQPRLRPADWTITDWRPPRRFIWESRQFGLVIVGDHELAAQGDGCTATLSVTFRGWLAPFVALFAGRLTRQYLDLEIVGLQKTAEAPAR